MTIVNTMELSCNRQSDPGCLPVAGWIAPGMSDSTSSSSSTKDTTESLPPIDKLDLSWGCSAQAESTSINPKGTNPEAEPPAYARPDDDVGEEQLRTWQALRAACIAGVFYLILSAAFGATSSPGAGVHCPAIAGSTYTHSSGPQTDVNAKLRVAEADIARLQSKLSATNAELTASAAQLSHIQMLSWLLVLPVMSTGGAVLWVLSHWRKREGRVCASSGGVDELLLAQSVQSVLEHLESLCVVCERLLLQGGRPAIEGVEGGKLADAVAGVCGLVKRNQALAAELRKMKDVCQELAEDVIQLRVAASTMDRVTQNEHQKALVARVQTLSGNKASPEPSVPGVSDADATGQHVSESSSRITYGRLLLGGPVAEQRLSAGWESAGVTADGDGGRERPVRMGIARGEGNLGATHATPQGRQWLATEHTGIRKSYEGKQGGAVVREGAGSSSHGRDTAPHMSQQNRSSPVNSSLARSWADALDN